MKEPELIRIMFWRLKFASVIDLVCYIYRVKARFSPVFNGSCVITVVHSDFLYKGTHRLLVKGIVYSVLAFGACDCVYATCQR